MFRSTDWCVRTIWNYYIGGFLLPNSDRERDLGIVVTPDLKSTEDTSRKVASANELFFAVRPSFSRLTPIFRLVFTLHVRLILANGIPAAYPLSKFECNLIKKVQRRGFKSILKLRNLPYIVFSA
ncbi:unnamed protein product [Dicrocoelium dendriticum]|nr:unnamed protein product [Dicrocoelium dendriticum]